MILPNFPKICMELKEFDPEGEGVRPKFYYVDLPLESSLACLNFELWAFLNCYLLPPANEVCEGYVFTGVCLSTGRQYLGRYMPGRYTPRQVTPGQVHPLAGTPPAATVHAGIRSTSGRYASYWIAFLFTILKLVM